MGSVLVTGGAGFIGSHLVEKLAGEGYKVVVLDNLSRGRAEYLPAEATLVRGDVAGGDVFELVKSADVVIHLAAVSRVIPCMEDPRTCIRSNVEGTEVVARACARYGKKLVFSSSREVYGSAKYLPVDESHPLDPENLYGVSKVSGEKIISIYAKMYGLRFVVLRLANVYGPRDFDRVIPIFIERALAGKDLVVYGGKKVLDFVYIDDVVDAIVKSLELDIDVVLNIGSGRGTSLVELAELVKRITGASVGVVVEPERRGEVDVFIANIARAKELLKWEPTITLEEGLRKLVRYYKSRNI